MIITLLILAGCAIGLYFWSLNQTAPSNRYRKSRSIPMQEIPTQPLHNMSDALFDSKKDETQSTLMATNSAKTDHSQPIDHTIILYLMAPEGQLYAGYELLQALLSAGLRFGKRRIFHRHVHKDGRGDILFHCASAVEPGTFDLTKMGAFTCTGLSFFFSTSAVEDPLATFDCLLETLDLLIEDLGGQVLDDSRTLFTKEKMIQYRQKIRASERNKMTTDMFA